MRFAIFTILIGCSSQSINQPESVDAGSYSNDSGVNVRKPTQKPIESNCFERYIWVGNCKVVERVCPNGRFLDGECYRTGVHFPEKDLPYPQPFTE